MKQRIVYICELGSDHEQLLRVYDVAKEANAAGYDVILVVRDLISTSALANKLSVSVLQAPLFLPRLRLQRQLVCLADTLQLAGYEHSGSLLSLVKAWRELLSLLRADVLVFDHAPTALLAASDLNCRKLIVGSGFNIPAAGRNLADWQPMQSRAELIEQQEDNVLKVINQVQRKLELPITGSISELYRCNRIVIDCFPQLDIYRERRSNAEYYTSVASYLPPVFNFRQVDKPRVVCLLDPAFRKFTPLVEALRASGCETLLILPGADPAILEPYQSAAFQITTLMPNLELLIKEADVFVGHGSMGPATLCMRLGKPMLILPMQLEQLYVGLSLQGLGIAKVVADQTNTADYQKGLTGALGNIKLRASARNFATNNRVYGHSTFGKGVVSAFADNSDVAQRRI